MNSFLNREIEGPLHSRTGISPSLRTRGTLRDVARAVGLSHSTVSNAYSRHDRLSLDLYEKILASARSISHLGPNPAARMPRTEPALTIAVVPTDSVPHAFEDQTAIFFSRRSGRGLYGAGPRPAPYVKLRSVSQNLQTAAAHKRAYSVLFRSSIVCSPHTGTNSRLVVVKSGPVNGK